MVKGIVHELTFEAVKFEVIPPAITVKVIILLLLEGYPSMVLLGSLTEA